MKKFFAVSVASFVLASCATTSDQSPRSLSDTRDFESLIVNGTLDSISPTEIQYPESLSETRRNSIIQARLAEIDVIYYRYESAISRDVRQGNFGFSLAEILVGGAGAVASKGTSQGLSAASAALAGTRSAYNKDILLDQSLQAFITQMRANRATVKSKILERLESSVTDYTLQAALSDLAQYEQAGTLGSALAGITEAAQSNERAAAGVLATTEERVFQVDTRRTPQVFGVHGRSLADYLANGTFPTTREERFALLTQCYNGIAGNGAVSLGEFIPVADDPANASLAQAVKNCMSTTFQINIS